MHSAGVLHRDLTPSNVLLNKDYILKVGDLSLARSAAKVKAEQGSTREYVTSLRYRAPEVLVARTIHLCCRHLVSRLHLR